MSPVAGKFDPFRDHQSQPVTPTTSRIQPSLSVPTRRARMSNLFSTIRASIYGVVLLFTVICLGMAGHFQTVLAASDLTRFVPFAIFVCSASLFIFVILLTFSFFLRERNPISTKIELACLGLMSLFWLVLGIYLTTSEAQSADVECFASDQLQVPLDDELADFHTDQYQAMYRVLNSFALMNAALVMFACFSLLFLAVRRHRKGDEHMWHGPVTSCAWFNNYENTKLTRGKSSSSSILPIASAQMGEAVLTEKPERKASTRREYSSMRQYQSYDYNRDRDPPSPPPKAARYGSGHGRPDRQNSGSSSRTPATHPNLENGGMLNPYSRARGHSRR